MLVQFVLLFACTLGALLIPFLLVALRRSRS
jgi:hypothetical protein